MDTDFESPAFPILCDLVASDRLLVVTGAGISLGLHNKYTGDLIPNWPDLLRSLASHLDSDLAFDAKTIVTDVLSEPSISSAALIEVASILRDASPTKFHDHLRRLVTPKPNSTGPIHEAIIRIKTRGILTFNYDDAHENAAEAAHIDCKSLIPDDEREFVALLKLGVRKHFILKAHGCVRRADGELILDASSYRNILARKPAYRAFVQALLTNFSCLFVGFGLADPDFDLFINTLAAAYGSPLGPHVVIRHKSQHSADSFVLKNKYGIETLYISDYSQIPRIIDRAAREPGPNLERTLAKCLADDFATRQAGHVELSQLGETGEICAQNVLHEKLASTADEFLISEIAYSLGYLNATIARDLLIQIVEDQTYKSSDPAARALTVLRSVLSPSDIGRIQSWRDRYASAHYPDDPNNRLHAYCEYLLVYIPAKYNSHRRTTP